MSVRCSRHGPKPSMQGLGVATPSSGKHHIHLWTSLTSLQRRKDAKDAKKPCLSKVTFLSLQRHFTSFKDGEYLSKMEGIFQRWRVSFKDGGYLSKMEGIFQRHLIFFQRC